jgi:hypothetical protein
MRQLEAFGADLGVERSDAGDVAAGLFRLVTKPTSIGFSPTKKMRGVVPVACCAALAADSPLAAITCTGRLANSMASAGSRSTRPCAQRYSIATLRPSA